MLVTNIVTKVAQMFCKFLGYFEKHHCLVKTAVVSVWASYEENGLIFILTSGHTVCNSSAMVRVYWLDHNTHD